MAVSGSIDAACLCLEGFHSAWRRYFAWRRVEDANDGPSGSQSCRDKGMTGRWLSFEERLSREISYTVFDLYFKFAIYL